MSFFNIFGFVIVATILVAPSHILISYKNFDMLNFCLHNMTEIHFIGKKVVYISRTFPV